MTLTPEDYKNINKFLLEDMSIEEAINNPPPEISELRIRTGWAKTPQMKSRKRKTGWLEEENRYLKENYLSKTNNELANELGRNRNTVVTQLRKLGLKRR